MTPNTNFLQIVSWEGSKSATCSLCLVNEIAQPVQTQVYVRVASAQVEDNIIAIYFCSNCLYGIKLVYLSLAGTFTSVMGSRCTEFKVYTNIQGYSQCCSQMTPARSSLGGAGSCLSQTDTLYMLVSSLTKASLVTSLSVSPVCDRNRPFERHASLACS